jgi:hypothetical protein
VSKEWIKASERFVEGNHGWTRMNTDRCVDEYVTDGLVGSWGSGADSGRLLLFEC